MARKPLLSGPVLNREDVQSRLAGDDVMSRIIENDREKNRRNASPPSEERPPSNEFPIIPSNDGMKPASNDDAIIPSHAPSSGPSNTPPIKASKHQMMETSNEYSDDKQAQSVSTPKQAPTPLPAPVEEGAETAAWTAAMHAALDAKVRAHLMQQMMAQGEKGPVTRLNVEMPEDLHLRLKQSCVLKRRSVKNVINALIAFYLEQEDGGVSIR